MAKKYLIKVYDTSGAYLTTWNDVASDIKYSNEINTAGGELKLTLARNAGDYGEGSDVDFGLKVVVYCIDKEMPNGEAVFQGYISSYTPIYKNNNVEITVLSYGAEFNDYMLEGAISDAHMHTATLASGASVNFGSEDSAGYESVAIAFRPTTSGYLGAVYIPVYSVQAGIVGTTYADLVYELWSGTPTSPTAMLDTTTHRFTDTTLIQSLSKYLSKYAGDLGSYYVPFNSVAYLSNAVTYFIKITPAVLRTVGQGNGIGILYNSTNVDANNTFYTKKYGNSFVATSGDGLIEAWEIVTGTIMAYNSYDPSNIIKSAIDAYNTKGGSITYSDTSIEDTGTSVSYTFNTNTIYEVVDKCLQLAPKDWYWFLDYASNTINYKVKSIEPDHIFSLEKDLIDAKFEKRIEDIVNTVYFTGGDIGGGVNLYRKYINQDSVNSYGVKSLKYTDGRVTVDATADTIANSILEARSQPELRVTLQVLDSNNEQGVGYDIESINAGDVVAVRNITQQVGLSTWDVGRWDDAYWDFNIYNLSSLLMQVRRIDYETGYATIHASTMPVDINKRIEDINRNLETLQTNANPNTPT